MWKQFDANVSVSKTRCYIAVRIKVLCLKWQKSRGHLALWSVKTLYARIQQMSCSKLETFRWRCQILVTSVVFLPFFFSGQATKVNSSFCIFPLMNAVSMNSFLKKKLQILDFVLKLRDSSLRFYMLLSVRVSVLRRSGVLSSYCPA